MTVVQVPTADAPAADLPTVRVLTDTSLPDDGVLSGRPTDPGDWTGRAAAGLRESKKLNTRAALAQAALQLTQERGYDAFTIADLVERVGVSRRTFSNYFAGKAECVAAAGDGWMDAALELIDRTAADVPLTALLRQILDNLADQIAATGELFLCVATTEPEVAAAASAMNPARSVRIAAVLTARTAIAADDIRAVLLADFCLAAGQACTARWVAAGRAGGRAALARDLDLAFSLIDFRRISAAPDPLL